MIFGIFTGGRRRSWRVIGALALVVSAVAISVEVDSSSEEVEIGEALKNGGDDGGANDTEEAGQMDVNMIPAKLSSAQLPPLTFAEASRQRKLVKGKRSVASSVATERIIGGSPSMPGRFPYGAALFHDGYNGLGSHATRFFKCGATVIATDLLLTAAHCLDSGGTGIRTYWPFAKLSLGEDQLSSNEFQVFGFREIRKHPSFEWKMLPDGGDLPVFDYAIIALHGHAQKVKPVKINLDPSKDPSPKNDLVMALGWGKDSDYGRPVDMLRRVQLRWISNKECSSIHMDSMPSYNICADGGLANGERKGGCIGDSGSPLLVTTETGNPEDDVQVGILSWLEFEAWGMGCTMEGYPSVYARISAEADWIREQVCELSEEPPEYFDCGAGGDNGDVDDLMHRGDPIPRKALISVSVTIDNHTAETGWLLRSVTERKTLRYVPPGTYQFRPPQITIDSSVVVRDNAVYALVLLDTYGDGLTGGSFRVLRGKASNPNATVLFSSSDFDNNGAFRYSVEHRFAIGDFDSEAPTVGPTHSPSTPLPTLVKSETPSYVFDMGSPFLTLNITFDNSPEQIGWSIVAHNLRSSDTKSRVVGIKPVGTYRDLSPGATITERINILGPEFGPQTYHFQIIDVGRNGLCCVAGIGSYEVSSFLGTDMEVIFRGTGKFDLLEQFDYDISWSFSSNQPKASACLESPINKFRHKKANKLKTCQWLQKKSSKRIKKICGKNKYNITEACPRSCNSCSFRLI